MIFIITSTGNKPESQFDMRFGRCGWFCVWNHEDKSTRFIKNKYRNSNGGAGLKAAELVAEYKPVKVISGYFGPKAKALLEHFNIQMETIETTEQKVSDIIQLLNH